MSVHKILLDYNEYVRLCNIEEKYEKLVKSGQSGSGINIAEDIQATEEKNKLMTPLVKRLPPITLPASATMTSYQADPKTAEDGGNTTSTQEEPWYFLGKPKVPET